MRRGRGEEAGKVRGRESVECQRSFKFCAARAGRGCVPPNVMFERTLAKEVCGERMYILNRLVVDSKQSIATMMRSRSEPAGVERKRRRDS